MVVGTYRIGASDLLVYEVGKNFCKKSDKVFPEAILTAELFRAHNNLKLIIDPKDKIFLKGGITSKKIVGARIDVLPNGKKLDKAYSLFAPKLTVHDEQSNTHWDVIFQNPSGKMAYIYTLEKDDLSKRAKYRKVDEFEKCLPKLRRNLMANIDTDKIVLPMLILLKTKMRVGNEIYYNKNSHKGLTTLKKNDIKILGNKVTFDYIAKDGVPQKMTETFPEIIIKKLRGVLKEKKANDFIFVDNKGHPIRDTAFEKAFEKYSGHKFYPHIVRSHYATEETLKFLKNNKNPTKEEVRKFYLKIANKLGHKKYSKKNGWINSYQVTLHHYIRPELVTKIAKIVK